MAGSITVGSVDAARRAAVIEREAKLERLQEVASKDARTTAGQLLQVERDFAERRVAAAGELAELERTAGDAVLEAALAGTSKSKVVGAQLANLKAELEALDSAVEAARAKRRKAIVDVFRARAEALRAEAAPLVAQAEREEALTAELLDLVEARKGVRPEFPGPPSSRMGAGALFPMSSGPIAFQVLPEQALREEAAEMEERAMLQEGARPKAHGTAEADTAAELLDQIFEDPMQLGPRVADVLEWTATAEAAEKARRQKVQQAGGITVDGYIDPAAPVRFRLSWSDSAIDAGHSGILATGPSIEEKLKAVQQDRLIEERATQVERALVWLEARGGDLRTAVARAEAAGGQEGIAARQWAQVLQDAGAVGTEPPAEAVAESDGEPEAAPEAAYDAAVEVAG